MITRADIEREFLAWISRTRPVSEKSVMRIFAAGMVAGMKLGLRIYRDGVADPYDWAAALKPGNGEGKDTR